MLDAGESRPSELRTTNSQEWLVTAIKPALHLVVLESTLEGSKVFRLFRAERMRCVFETEIEDLDVSSLEAQIDGRPHRVLLVGKRPDGLWEINLKLDKSIGAGSHNVRVRTAGTAFSNALPFEVSPAES
jgi:hypothetical protein